MMKKQQKLIILLSFFSFLSVFINAQESFPDFSEFIEKTRKDIQKEMKKKNVAGASIAIMYKDSIFFAEGFGYADKEKGIPSDENTVYPLGSLSKAFTHTAVLHLYSKGVIDINKPYTDYVPEFSMKKHFNEDRPFTVKDLLTHCAGVPRVVGQGWNTDTPTHFRYLLDELQSEYLMAPPGIVDYYSDLGVTLLGILIEKVTKRNFDEYLQELYSTIGIKSLYYGRFENCPNLSKCYNKKKLSKILNTRGWPSDGAACSAIDVVKLAKAYFQKEGQNKIITKKDVVKQALTRQNNHVKYAYDSKWGLGLIISDVDGTIAIQHGGAHYGYNCRFMMLPKYDLAVAVIVNTEPYGGLLNTWEIMSRALKVLGHKEIHEPEKELVKTKLIPEEFNDITGTYASYVGIVKIKEKNEKLSIDALNMNWKLKPYKNNFFKMEKSILGINLANFTLSIEKDAGKTLLFKHEWGLKNLIGEKCVPVTIPETWKNCVGSYKVINYEEDEFHWLTDCSLSIIDSFLVLKITTPSEDWSLDFILNPKTDKLAVAKGIAGQLITGETIEIINTNPPRIKVSGYILERKNYDVSKR